MSIEGDQLVSEQSVLFEAEKAVLSVQSFAVLDEIAAMLVLQPELGRVEIGHHTDSQGVAALSLQLSNRRAQAVRTYLVARGVSSDRLVAVGYGESRPIASNASDQGREQNRRVEFRLLDGAPEGMP